MIKLFRKPHILFWSLAPVFLIGAFILGNRELDVNIREYYFALPYTLIGVAVALLFGLYGLFYWVYGKKQGRLSVRLNAVHMVCTLVGPLGAFIIPFFYREIAMPVTDLMAYSRDTQFNDRLWAVTLVLWGITFLGQIVLPINLLKARRRSSPPHGE